MKKLNGYDIDGVLTVGITPEKPYVVISGRTFDEWEKTIKEIGTDAPIYLRPNGEYGDELRAGLWKAEMINNLKITEFIEDSVDQAAIIKELCPNCDVKIVGVDIKTWNGVDLNL